MNWLFWLVIILLTGLTIWGHYRGFFKMAVGLAALIIAIIGTCLLGAPIAGKLCDSGLQEFTQEKLNVFVEKNITGNLEEMAKTAQDTSIDELPLPKAICNVLKKNNTLDKYREMGVDTFREYLCKYLAKMVIYSAAYAILFIVLVIAAHIVFHLLDVVAKLPGIHGANQLAGAALGLAEALAYVWVFFLILTAFSSKDWAASCLTMIKDSQFLSLLFENNLLLQMILYFIK